MESSECFSVNNKSQFLVSINNKEYMKKFLLQAFAVAFCLGSGVFVASCDDDNNPVDNPPIDGETAYVVEPKWLAVPIGYIKDWIMCLL